MTEPTTDEIARWAALSESATPGPWARTHRGIEAGYDDVIVPGHVECMAYCYGGSSTIEGDRLETDTEFIAAARTAVPRLLALVAAQAGQIAELEGEVTVARSRLQSVGLDWALVIEACRNRADQAEAKIARVRAALDADERSSVLLAIARAIIDDEPAGLDGTEDPA